jgi:hypothetical protein
MTRLYAPNGNLIEATAETILASAIILDDDITRNEDGTFEFSYLGDTEIHWDTQETNRNDEGQRIFLDRVGNEWPESQLLLLTEEEWNERFAEKKPATIKVQVPAEIVDDVIRALVSSGTPDLEAFAQQLKDQRFKVEG